MEVMKNGLSQPAIKRISKALTQIIPNFAFKSFENDCLEGLADLELKDRVNHIMKVLHHYLPSDFDKTADILIKVKTVWDFGDPDDALKSFAAWPIIDYFSVYGINHPEISLNALKQLTHLFSAEFAIRAFIIKYPEYCHEQFTLWVADESEHVRRLVSEGTRPRLPWGIQLKPFIAEPQINIPLLSSLKSDPSLYVRRSVANHLNDIAKDHPYVVINTCKEWKKSKLKAVDWVIKHATRTLVKQGFTEVFALLGYTDEPKLLIKRFNLSGKEIKLGETIAFNFDVVSDDTSLQNIVIDYAIYFVKANGESKAKVFKLKNISLDKGETITLEKSFSFKAITTRKYYKGQHKIEILVNGKGVSSKSFTVS